MLGWLDPLEDLSSGNLRSQDIKIEVSENFEPQPVARTGSGLPGDWRPLNTSKLLDSSASLTGVLCKAYVLSGCGLP